VKIGVSLSPGSQVPRLFSFSLFFDVHFFEQNRKIGYQVADRGKFGVLGGDLG